MVYIVSLQNNSVLHVYCANIFYHVTDILDVSCAFRQIKYKNMILKQ